MEHRTYSTEQVSRALDVPSRTLQRWIADELVRPVTGHVVLWTDRDVREARVASRLVRQLGLSTEAARQIMKKVRESGAAEGAQTRAVYLEILIPDADDEPIPAALRVTLRPQDREQTVLALAS